MARVLGRDDAHGQGVVQVVAVVGDGVGHVDHLAFQGRPAGLEALGRRGVVARGVFGDALADLVGQVQPSELRVGVLEVVDDADAVAVVLETAGVGHQLPQGLLARVAEGRVAEVVGQRHRLGQVLVQVEGPGDGPGDLGHLHRVRQACAEEVALVRQEDLRLVFEAAEGRRVDDAVAVALVGGPVFVFRFGVDAAAALGAFGGIGGKFPAFALLSVSAGQHGARFLRWG